MIFKRNKEYPEKKAWPIGSVFLSIVSTNPGTLLGYGTWTQIAIGQMLVGFKTADADFGVVEGTGGAKTHTHAGHNNHVVTQPNNHVVTQPNNHVVTQPNTHTVVANIQGALPGDVVTTGAHAGTAVDAHAGTAVDAHAGTAVDAHSAHDTVSQLNPFFTVYVWKRTA